MAMIFSKLYAISEELRIGIQCSVTCSYQGREAFGNAVDQFCQFLCIELCMPDIQVDVLGHKA